MRVCKVAMGQGRSDSFASTLKVERSAVGSGSGRPGRVWPMSQLGRNYWFWIEGGEGPESAQPRRCRAFRRRFPHHPICGPCSSCIANRWVFEFTTYALAKLPEAQLDGDEGNEGSQGFGEVLEIFARRRFRPNRGALDDPAARPDDEALHVVTPLDDLHAQRRSAGTSHGLNELDPENETVG
jgi:hypothetical protein